MNLKDLIGKRSGNIELDEIEINYDVRGEYYRITFKEYINLDYNYDTGGFETKREFISWLVKHKFIKPKDAFLDLL